MKDSFFKRIALGVVLSLIKISGFSQQTDTVNQFSIHGVVEGRNTGILCLYYRDIEGNRVRDTMKLNDGRFSFSGKIHEPTEAALADNIGPLLLDDPNFVELYLEPSKMNILLQQNNYKKIIVRGSKTQQQSMDLELSKKTLYDTYNSLKKKISVLEKNTKGNEHELNILQDSLEYIKALVKDKDLFYIKKNPKSFLTLGLLFDYFSLKELTLDSAKNLFDGLDTSIKNSASAQKLKLAFDNREKNSGGKDAFDFVKFDITGNKVKLSSFRGKNYVLLDFWASWCAPCFEINPEVIQIFKKYSSSGLIVMGISLDSDEKKWKSSIPKYNNYLWPNFLDVQGPDSNLRAKFDILAIPELVLIDKNGKIVGQYLGQEKNSDLSNLSATLKSVFQK